MFKESVKKSREARFQAATHFDYSRRDIYAKLGVGHGTVRSRLRRVASQ
jgi:transposase